MRRILVIQETIAGVSLQQIYRPTVLPSEYPVLDTRPISSLVNRAQLYARVLAHTSCYRIWTSSDLKMTPTFGT